MSAALKMRGLSPTEKLTLIALANYADENEQCWPSNRRLTEDTGLSERTVRDTIKALGARGLLTKTERLRPNGSRATDVVTLQLGGATVAPHPETGGAALAPQEGATVAGGVGQPLPGGGATVAPLTSFEPSVEPPKKKEGANAPSVRATKRCPPDFIPSQGAIDVGKGEGLSPREIEREIAKFRDSTFGTPRSDWDATLKNWFRKAAEQLGHHRSPATQAADPRRANTESRRGNWVELAHERAREGASDEFDFGGGGNGSGDMPNHLRLAHSRNSD